MRIYKSKFKDVECIVLENDFLRVKILPSHGAKIASIYYKQSDYEALVQNPHHKFKYSDYEQIFTMGEMAGADDMLPTVTECQYINDEYYNSSIPDHGEVWALPWKYNILKNSIEMAVSGVVMPYTLEKSMTLQDDNIHVEYSVVNNGKMKMDFIWALHPLFKATEGMEIVFPETVKEIINVFNANKVMGGFGEIYSWPEFTDINGNKRNISIVPKPDNTCMKFYAVGTHEGYCALKNFEDNIMIELKYPSQIVNYLGVWTDYLGFKEHPLYNVALEPCIGGYDSLEYAQHNKSCATLSAGEKLDWYIDINIKKIKD